MFNELCQNCEHLITNIKRVKETKRVDASIDTLEIKGWCSFLWEGNELSGVNDHLKVFHFYWFIDEKDFTDSHFVFLSINSCTKRSVRDKNLLKAIKQAYLDFVKQNVINTF